MFRADLFGVRLSKYDALDASDLLSTQWQELKPAAPAYLFVSQDADLFIEYQTGWSLRDIFAPNGDPAPGIVTTHDDFAISWTAEEAAAKVERLLATATEAEAREHFKLCSQDQWRYARAKEELAEGSWRERVVPILYRPFDLRWTVYDRNVAVHRRERAFDHFIGRKNIGLAMMRQSSVDQGYSHILALNTIADNRAQYSNRGIMAASPLWLYASASTDLLNQASDEKRPNLAAKFVEELSSIVSGDPSPEETFAWLYAVLYTPSYRNRYADFLRRDFPRVPLPPGRELFDKFVIIGHELIALHTMEQKQPRVSRFDITGSNEVGKVRWVKGNDDMGRVYINNSQHFDNVPQCVWDIHMGGYRVAEKWLKDRKGRQLSFEDVMHYHEVVAALSRTLELQAVLDALLDARGGWPLRGDC